LYLFLIKKTTIFPLSPSCLATLRPAGGFSIKDFIMVDEKKGFIIYKDWCLTILELMKDNEDPLTHSELGMLMEAVFSYQSNGEDLSKNLPKHIRFLFKNILDVFNRDLDKWQVTREKRKESGRLGGLKKANNSIKPQEVSKVPKEKTVPFFDDFYSLYPKKQGKEQAIKAYQKALKKTTHEVIMAGVKNYKDQIASKNTEMQYIKQPATWLNAGCWDDDYTIETKQNLADINAMWANEPKGVSYGF
jgi:hypothetical protein